MIMMSTPHHDTRRRGRIVLLLISSEFWLLSHPRAVLINSSAAQRYRRQSLVTNNSRSLSCLSAPYPIWRAGVAPDLGLGLPPIGRGLTAGGAGHGNLRRNVAQVGGTGESQRPF